MSVTPVARYSYRYGRLIEIRSSDELVPIDFHDTFVRVLSPCHEGDAVAELMDSESTQPFLAERKALMLERSSIRQPLPLTMVVSGDQPDRTEHIECHALPIVGNHDHGFLLRCKFELNDGFTCVRVISVLDQFENCQPGVAYQLVAEQLQHPRPWPKWFAEFAQNAVTHWCVLSGLTAALSDSRNAPDFLLVSSVATITDLYFSRHLCCSHLSGSKPY